MANASLTYVECSDEPAMLLDRYPDVALEEAERLVDLLGWDDVMEEWARNIFQPLETMGKNRYIFGLMGALFHELEDCLPHEQMLTPQQWQWAQAFYVRVQQCERVEAIL